MSTMCNSCERREIANKFHKLCVLCNKERLDAKKDKKPLNKPIRVRGNTREYTRTIKEISLTRDKFCTACGTTSNLTNSHLIPRSIRKDLTNDPRNIVYHCSDCHAIWDHGVLQDKKKMQDFYTNIELIKQLDQTYYERTYERVTE